jgi:hypothetical protein
MCYTQSHTQGNADADAEHPEQDICAICHDNLDEESISMCEVHSHRLHRECIRNVLESSLANNCPLCRAPMSNSEARTLRTFDVQKQEAIRYCNTLIDLITRLQNCVLKTKLLQQITDSRTYIRASHTIANIEDAMYVRVGSCRDCFITFEKLSKLQGTLWYTPVSYLYSGVLIGVAGIAGSMSFYALSYLADLVGTMAR